MIKVIIAGTRDFNDYDFLKKNVDYFLQGINPNNEEIEIVSGNARGADKLGERYAKEHNLPVKLFPANWDKYGKRAGYLRNQEMANYADVLIAFWDEKSKGTKHMIDIAKKQGLTVIVVGYVYRSGYSISE